MNNIWLISDTHFGHEGLAKICVRPENYEQKILSSVIKNIQKDDLLIHLGDVAFNGESDWVNVFCMSVDCKKWLVLGNHDNHSIFWYLERGFDAVFNNFTLDIYGEKILFSHEPQQDLGQYTLNVHGHLHNFSLETIKEKDPEVFKVLNDKQYLIALESSHYQVQTLEFIIKKIKRNKNLS